MKTREELEAENERLKGEKFRLDQNLHNASFAAHTNLKTALAFDEKRAHLEKENKRLRERIEKLENSVVELWHMSPISCGIKDLYGYLDMTDAEYA